MYRSSDVVRIESHVWWARVRLRGAPAPAPAFGMGDRVQLAGLDTTTNGAADGYRPQPWTGGHAAAQCDRTAGRGCTNSTPTKPCAPGDFDGNVGNLRWAELVLVSTARQQRNLPFPATAVTGGRLRLRIAADYVNAPAVGLPAPRPSIPKPTTGAGPATCLGPSLLSRLPISVAASGPCGLTGQPPPTTWRWTS
jgi:hypothetical protein